MFVNRKFEKPSNKQGDEVVCRIRFASSGRTHPYAMKFRA